MSVMASSSTLKLATRTANHARPARCLSRSFSSGLSARSEQPEDRHPRRTSCKKDSRIDSLVSLYQQSTSFPPISNPILFDSYLQQTLLGGSGSTARPKTSAELDKTHRSKGGAVMEDRYDRDMPLGRHGQQGQRSGESTALETRETRIIDALHGTYKGSQLGKDLVEEIYEANELASGQAREPILEEAST